MTELSKKAEGKSLYSCQTFGCKVVMFTGLLSSECPVCFKEGLKVKEGSMPGKRRS